jgi:hypothetical protein
MILNLCPPAIIYFIFSLTQILIDLYNGLYNTAFMKGIVMIMVTVLLNILCERNMSIVAWIIVFVPFILMTVVVSMLLYIFGLDAATGKLKNNKNCNSDVTTDSSGNIIVYDPDYKSSKNPVYYKSPNIIIPNPTNTTLVTSNEYQYVPEGSSSPAYQS